MTSSAGDEEEMSVGEAAMRLGISERAVRKRIAAGTLHAERHEGRWLVSVPEGISARRAEAPMSGVTPLQARPAKPEPATAMHSSTPPSELSNQSPEPITSVPGDHASDLLRMIRDLHQQNLELAGQVGFLQAKLASAQDQLLLTESADEDEPAPALVVPERRSLLDRLFGR